ncbi:MAG: transcription-repair coupling factor [Ruminococcaceae bacterium]|nr:transcription-repair coupling factor [Oscillospiraceae bacterium]
MSILTDSIREDGEYGHLLKTVRRELSVKNPLPILISGLCDGAADALFISTLNDLSETKNPVLIVCAEEKECVRMKELLTASGIRAAHFSGRELTLYNISASHEYEHERLSVLSGIIFGRLSAVLTTPDALLGYTIPREVLREASLRFDTDGIFSIEDVAKKLIAAGYSRVDITESPGQFAVRGGIVDIFPPNGVYECVDGIERSGARPVRIELFGDEIDRMGIFDPATQRLTVNLTSIEIPPAREVLADTKMLEKIRESVKNQQKRTNDARAKEELEGEINSLSAAINGGGEVSFTDKYIIKIYPQKECLLSYFDTRSLVFIKGTEAVNDRMKAARWHEEQTVQGIMESGTLSSVYAEFSAEVSEYSRFLSENVVLHIDSLARGLSGQRLSGMFGFKTRHTVSYAGNFKLLTEDIEEYKNLGWRMVVAAENETAAKSLCELLTGNGYRAYVESELGEYTPKNLPAGCVLVSKNGNIRGFELAVPKIAVLSTMAEERGSSASAKLRRRTAKKKNAKSILSYNELNVGDYVVHENYGIGQYEGIENLTVDGVSKDYINIRFAGADRLFLPTERLDMLSKYIGARADDGFVRLSKFGGAEWGRAKSRAKAAVKEIAKDLIQLYAERQRRPGYAFPADDDFQRDFETAFEYEETDSQLAVADEIKADMMRPVPMDRLLCGDVGFGKTEVALRAAYKAVLGGKQVAVLVPTTILALQHYQTFTSRMRAFGVTVDMVSRFRSPKQQKETVRNLELGNVDIIIGTHRLLSKDIKFNDLGLLVVDEEQRFGVSQKEKLKQLAKNVDVLTLTATPIPRTLNMAMGGIRDISVLDEAPGDRLPVQTYVMEHDDLIIFEAVRRELRRGGQVFYLHNFVESIDGVAARLAAAFPEATVTTAHGKMEKERLEDIWRSMLTGETDILVCTSIIETGVDVPNANTLIVDNAHRLGLSQLHQIRGRVGRSSRRAYAYFTYPRGRALTEIAEKRLEAMKEYAEFGAGFRIALRDLELRGAGNLLGSEQHGHLDAIGYELYIKLLHDAVLEEQGNAPEEKTECKIDLSFDAFIPEKYVQSQAQRMSLYRRIATVREKEDCDDIYDELSDRYGDVPRQIENLLAIALIRSRAETCGMTRVTQKGGEVKIYPQKFEIPVWQELADEFSLRVIMAGEPYVALRLSSKTDALSSLSELFSKYLEIRAKEV